MNMKNINIKSKDEKSVIIEGLRRLGRRAYNTARDEGFSVTVLRGNNVCRIEPDGSTVIISKTGQAKCKVSQRKYSLR